MSRFHLLSVIALLSACDEREEALDSDASSSPEELSAKLGDPSTVKVEICHESGFGKKTHVIEVSVAAVAAHVAHGDWRVGEEECDDGIDNDCDGVVDTDCCPCFLYSELDELFDAGGYACAEDEGLVAVWGVGKDDAYESAWVREDPPYTHVPTCSIYEEPSEERIRENLSASELATCIGRLQQLVDDRLLECE